METWGELFALDLGVVCVWGEVIRKRCCGKGRTTSGPADNGQRMEPPGGFSCRKLLCLREAVRGVGWGVAVRG